MEPLLMGTQLGSRQARVQDSDLGQPAPASTLNDHTAVAGDAFQDQVQNIVVRASSRTFIHSFHLHSLNAHEIRKGAKPRAQVWGHKAARPLVSRSLRASGGNRRHTCYGQIVVTPAKK